MLTKLLTLSNKYNKTKETPNNIKKFLARQEKSPQTKNPHKQKKTYIDDDNVVVEKHGKRDYLAGMADRRRHGYHLIRVRKEHKGSAPTDGRRDIAP